MLVRQHGQQPFTDLDEQLVETRASGEKAGKVGEPKQRFETVGKIFGETADFGLGCRGAFEILANLHRCVPAQGELVAFGRVGVFPAVGVAIDDEATAPAFGERIDGKLSPVGVRFEADGVLNSDHDGGGFHSGCDMHQRIDAVCAAVLDGVVHRLD